MQEIFIPLFFLLIADLIKIDVSDNFVNLSEHFMQMSGDLSFEKRKQREFAVFTMLWQCPHNRPSRHGYLLATDYKNHPIGQLWISKQRLKAKCQNLITMENKKA